MLCDSCWACGHACRTIVAVRSVGVPLAERVPARRVWRRGDSEKGSVGSARCVVGAGTAVLGAGPFKQLSPLLRSWLGSWNTNCVVQVSVWAGPQPATGARCPLRSRRTRRPAAHPQQRRDQVTLTHRYLSPQMRSIRPPPLPQSHPTPTTSGGGWVADADVDGP